MRSDLSTPTVKAVVKSTSSSFDSYTKLCMHFDGADESTTFTISKGPTGITAAAVGGAKIDTAQSVFGGASAYFDGTGDYVELSAASSDFAFGTDPFTIEFRARPAASGKYVMGCDFAVGWLVYIETGLLRFYVAGTSYEFTWSINLDEWVSVAIVRSGTTLHLYKNGAEQGSGVACSADITAANPVWIGNDYGRNVPFSGYIDELRISNSARYTSNFTPDTAAFGSTSAQYAVKTFTLT
jgi:hypothetical protein